MKKITFLLTMILLITLSGCVIKPYETDEEGFTFIETDTITFELLDEEIFSYQFDGSLKMFVNEEGSIYNFKNINNYEEASGYLLAFIRSFGDNVMYRTTVAENFDDEIKLSTGATEDDYNLEKVAHDGEVWTEDAFITDESGLTIILSYTKFYVEDELIIVPSFIQMFVEVIHQETSWEFLPEDNEYLDERAKIINYDMFIVPLPMKTGALSSWADMTSNGQAINEYTRVVANSTTNTGTWEVCEDCNENACITPISTTLEVQIYDMKEADVIEFYEENFGGIYDGEDFIFVLDGVTFVIYDIEEVLINDPDNPSEYLDVVNAKIRLY